MGVPGHDERDFNFARKYGLDTPVVIVSKESSMLFRVEMN